MCDTLLTLSDINSFINFKYELFSFYLYDNYEYIFQNIKEYLSNRKNLLGVMNIDNFANILLIDNNNYIVINNIFVEQIHRFIETYYTSYSFKNGKEYNFVNCEFFSRMLQYEIVPLILLFH